MTSLRARAQQPSQARHLILAVAAGGAGVLTTILLIFPVQLETAVLQRALLLVGVTAAAELFAIRLTHGDTAENLTLFELAVVADIVLLPPSLAALVSIAGLAIALAIGRKPLRKVAFNLGQYALGICPAIALYHALGDGTFTTDAGLISLFIGMTIFTVLNFVTISAIIAATSGRSMKDVLREERSLSLAMGLGNSAVGMVAVSLYMHRPALLPAIIAPVAALHVAFKGWVRQKELVWQMHEESTKLGRILDASSEGIVLVDSLGRVELWSPSMEKITGVGAASAVGKAIAYLLRGHDVYGRAISVGASSSSEPTEIAILDADGNIRWLRVLHGPGFDARGELSFDVLVVTDITRQREVDKLKEDFFSTVSHELRTPLTPIKGYATLLLKRGEDIPPDRRQDALQAIVERTDHMARLVEDLLLASRISNPAERRMPDVNRQDVDVAGVVERALRSFRVAHPTREFRVRGHENVTCSGDPIRVEQIVANLISNAVKFSEEGTLVDVCVTPETRETIIEVTDEGRGIPADKFEEIFERFKRLEDPMVMETGGAGLGLYIVRELARAMGGTVSVRSEIGRGSTFTVTLPAVGVKHADSPHRRRSDESAPMPVDAQWANVTDPSAGAAAS